MYVFEWQSERFGDRDDYRGIRWPNIYLLADSVDAVTAVILGKSQISTNLFGDNIIPEHMMVLI